jgi:hypothetical protein
MKGEVFVLGTELWLLRIIVLLRFMPNEYQFSDRLGVGPAALEAVSQVEGALLIFVGALPGSVAHGDKADHRRALLLDGTHSCCCGYERS